MMLISLIMDHVPVVMIWMTIIMINDNAEDDNDHDNDSENVKN